MLRDWQCFFYKLRLTKILPQLLLANVLFIAFMCWYIKTAHLPNSKALIFFYSHYNLLLQLMLAILIGRYFQLEENGNFMPKILQLPARVGWLLNLNLGFSLIFAGVILFNYTIILAVLQPEDWFFYFGTMTAYSFLFNLILIPFYIFIALKFSSVLSMALSMVLIIFSIYYGMNTLGDGIRQYVPLLYPYVALKAQLAADWTTVAGLITVSLLTLITLFTLVATWFRAWDGK